MVATEVVARANQIHSSFDGRLPPRRHPRASSEDRQTAAEGSIQPLNKLCTSSLLQITNQAYAWLHADSILTRHHRPPR